MTLIPTILSAFFGTLVLLSLVRDWFAYRKLRRIGQMTRRTVNGHLSADILGIVIGLGVAWGSNRLIAVWLSRRSWTLPEWVLLALSVGLTLAVVVFGGKLYARYADSRVRTYLLSDPQDGDIE